MENILNWNRTDFSNIQFPPPQCKWSDITPPMYNTRC